MTNNDEARIQIETKYISWNNVGIHTTLCGHSIVLLARLMHELHHCVGFHQPVDLALQVYTHVCGLHSQHTTHRSHTHSTTAAMSNVNPDDNIDVYVYSL